MIGVMQGRLLPPVNGQLQAFPQDWGLELDICQSTGIDCIEWIYGSSTEHNPIADFSGARYISRFRHPCPVGFSLCADYFVKAPLLRIPENILEDRLDKLEWLIFQCRLAAIPLLVLPFVDDNAIRNDSELYAVSNMMHTLNKLVNACDVTICLETNLSPEDTEKLLYKCPRHIRINYDTGNSASLGYSMGE